MSKRKRLLSLYIQNPTAYANTLPIIIPYVNTLPCTKARSCHEPTRIEHEKNLNFVSQSETIFTKLKNTRELSARLEVPSRLWAHLNKWRDLHPPQPDQLTFLLLLISFEKKYYGLFFNLGWCLTYNQHRKENIRSQLFNMGRNPEIFCSELKKYGTKSLNCVKVAEIISMEKEIRSKLYNPLD